MNRIFVLIWDSGKGTLKMEELKVFGVFGSPPDLESSTRNRQPIHIRPTIKRAGSMRIHECHKGDILVFQMPNLLNDTTSYIVAQLFGRRIRVDITKVDISIPTLGTERRIRK